MRQIFFAKFWRNKIEKNNSTNALFCLLSPPNRAALLYHQNTATPALNPDAHV